MRVLLHCVYYSPEVGGLESHVSGLAVGLVKRGIEVRVVTSKSQARLSSEEELDGVRIRRVWLPSRSPAGWLGYALGSIPVTRRWGRWADVVHAQSFASVLPAGLSAAGRPWLASFHTSHFLMRARRSIWTPILRWLVRWPDHALAASEEIAEVAMQLAGDRSVEPLTNGVDTEAFRRQERTAVDSDPASTIVVPRRLVQKNGVEVLMRALPEIRSGIPDVRVLVIGDGPERGNLEALATELGVVGSIRFLGSRPHSEMPGLLSAGEIAVFPSLMEATSVGALEAMSCQLAVVASAVGGLPEIVDDQVGMLVPPRDASALARAVLGLLRDERRREKGRRGRERVVARWSNERLVERHVEIYKDLLEGRVVKEPSGVGGAG